MLLGRRLLDTRRNLLDTFNAKLQNAWADTCPMICPLRVQGIVIVGVTGFRLAQENCWIFVEICWI